MQHGFYIASKLFFCFVKIVIENPIAAIQGSFFARQGIGEVYILTDIRYKIVAIDRVLYFPDPGSHAIGRCFIF